VDKEQKSWEREERKIFVKEKSVIGLLVYIAFILEYMVLASVSSSHRSH
jgi:hypothetical protein